MCYSSTDPWTKVLNYGFATTSTVAHSIGATIALPGGRKLSIGRNFLNVTVENNFKFPVMQIDGDEILLSPPRAGLRERKGSPARDLLQAHGARRRNATRLRI